MHAYLEAAAYQMREAPGPGVVATNHSRDVGAIQLVSSHNCVGDCGGVPVCNTGCNPGSSAEISRSNNHDVICIMLAGSMVKEN